MAEDPITPALPDTEGQQQVYDKNNSPQWDTLLSKYVRVWIWSVLFGATTGLSYAYVGIRFDRSWGPLAVLPLALITLGAIATLGAWWNLLTHLRYSILPTFFDYSPNAKYDGDPKYQDFIRRRAAVSITKAYKNLLVAGIARLMLVMADLMFEALRGMSF